MLTVIRLKHSMPGPKGPTTRDAHGSRIAGTAELCRELEREAVRMHGFLNGAIGRSRDAFNRAVAGMGRQGILGNRT